MSDIKIFLLNFLHQSFGRSKILGDKVTDSIYVEEIRGKGTAVIRNELRVRRDRSVQDIQ